MYTLEELEELATMQRDDESLGDLELRIVREYLADCREKGIDPVAKIRAFLSTHRGTNSPTSRAASSH